MSNVGSIVAVAVSVFALALGAYQTRLMQSQARASVWPYLSIGYTYSSNTDKDAFIWTVNNNGVGPAKVESVVLTLDDKPVIASGTLSQTIASLQDRLKAVPQDWQSWATLGLAYVPAPGGDIEYIDAFFRHELGLEDLQTYQKRSSRRICSQSIVRWRFLRFRGP